MNYPDNVIVNFTGDHAFMSNSLVLSPNRRVAYEGILYPSVDHAYQAAKTLDTHQREFIASVSAPNVARILANHLVRRPDWLDVRLGIMRELIYVKFAANANEFMPKLLATGHQFIAYNDPKKDPFWGAVYNESTGEWSGHNYIGKAIIALRTHIQNPCRPLDWDFEFAVKPCE